MRRGGVPIKITVETKMRGKVNVWANDTDVTASGNRLLFFTTLALPVYWTKLRDTIPF